MIWQDILLGSGSVGFCVALIPCLKSKDKPDWRTSLMTGLILLSFSVAYGTLRLWFAMGTSVACGALWMTLFEQVRSKERWI